MALVRLMLAPMVRRKLSTWKQADGVQILNNVMNNIPEHSL
jgi:hypothetical protein